MGGTLTGYEPVGYEITLNIDESASENKYSADVKAHSPYDTHKLVGDITFDPTYTYYTSTWGYSQKEFDHTIIVSSSKGEMKMQMKNSMLEEDVIVSVQYKLFEDNKLVYIKKFTQLPVLGSQTHELDITEDKLATGSIYTILLRGDGTKYDGEVNLRVAYEDNRISADVHLEAYHFFGEPYSGSFSFFIEDNGTTKNFSASIPNYFLLEGTYQPTEEGFQTRLKGTRNNEEVVNASLAVDTYPGFVHFTAGPGRDTQMVEVRVGLEDILNAEFYVQPQIFTHMMGYLY